MPKFDHHLFICGNSRKSGHARGCCDPEEAGLLRARFKEALSLRGLKDRARANRAGCLDQCEHGPNVVIYPEAVWYGGVQLSDVDEIVEKHIEGGEIVSRLLIPDACLNNKACPHRVKAICD